MKKLLFIIGIITILLLTGCSNKLKDLEEAPEFIEPEPVTMEKEITNYLEQNLSTGDETRKENLKLKEGCFYTQKLVEYEKAGIAFYRLEFYNDEGIQGYNITSKTMTTINTIRDAKIGICIYNDKWLYFDQEGNAWNVRTR